jgi:hypothetical protein
MVQFGEDRLIRLDAVIWDTGHDKLPTYGGTTFQKVVDAMAALQVIQKHLDWNTSAGETGNAAHTLFIDPDDLPQPDSLLGCHNSSLGLGETCCRSKSAVTYGLGAGC